MSFFERLKRLLGSSDSPARPSGATEGGSGAGEPISCMEALERLHEYLDGELESASHEEVAQHFSMCQKCYPHLRLEERFREALQRTKDEEACPEHVKSQVLELLAAEAGEPTG